MKILAVEDDEIFLDTLEILVEKLGYTFFGVDNAKSLFKALPAIEPDLLLLDIHVKGTETGLDIAERLQTEGKNIPIIFVTSLKDDQVFTRAKKTNPFAYIIKPFDERTLQLSIELALYKTYLPQNINENITKITPETTNKNTNIDANIGANTHTFKGWQEDILLKDFLFIKTGDKLEKVQITDIAHITIDDKYLEINTQHKNYVARLSLQDIMQILPNDVFFRIHRKNIININFIENIYPKDTQIEVAGKRVAYSQNYSEALLKRLNLIS